MSVQSVAVNSGVARNFDWGGGLSAAGTKVEAPTGVVRASSEIFDFFYIKMVRSGALCSMDQFHQAIGNSTNDKPSQWSWRK